MGSEYVGNTKIEAKYTVTFSLFFSFFRFFFLYFIFIFYFLDSCSYSLLLYRATVKRAKTVVGLTHVPHLFLIYLSIYL